MANKVDLKVVLLGSAMSGKTSLVERYVYERFTGQNQSVRGALAPGPHPGPTPWPPRPGPPPLALSRLTARLLLRACAAGRRSGRRSAPRPSKSTGAWSPWAFG